MDRIEHDFILANPEQGMIAGNGDFCASVYLDGDEMVWRLGKGDVWDRRLDLSRNPPPAHIEELKRGLEVERWCCPADGSEVYALNGTDTPERMRDICRATPSELLPYPNPKPVGELRFRLPVDFHGLKISWCNHLTDGVLETLCSYDGGETLTFRTAFDPDEDTMAISWDIHVADYEGTVAPVDCAIWHGIRRWFWELRRHADRPYPEFTAAVSHPLDLPLAHQELDAPPLPPPTVEMLAGHPFIRQGFPADPTFPEGFEYRMTLWSHEAEVANASRDGEKGVRLSAVPTGRGLYGTVVVYLATSLSPGGAVIAGERAAERYGADPAGAAAVIFRQAAIRAREFWSQSSFQCSDALLEQIWHEQLHLNRSIFGRGSVPPGLNIPCMIQDYSAWHGDYHSNYNFQSPFWGLAVANHAEQLESFFAGAEFFYPVGRKIARDYYNARGCFIQLSAYPIQAADDWLGCCPMGRMAYMTGWMWRHYYERWRYTMDREFLRNRGYPAIRDSALFFTDFMQLGADGCYHLFPSNCGEDGFNGDPSYYLDRAENLLHAHYTLVKAVETATELGVDASLVEEWNERLAHWPPVSPHDEDFVMGDDEEIMPEFRTTRWLDVHSAQAPEVLFRPGHEFWIRYFGHAPLVYQSALRCGIFAPERDYDNLRQLMARWREPNGALVAMSALRYGRVGGWTESLGMLAVIQELALQSWDGTIVLFPAWPRRLEGKFENWRGNGGAYVSAEYKAGAVSWFRLTAAVDGILRWRDPWTGDPVSCFFKAGASKEFIRE